MKMAQSLHNAVRLSPQITRWVEDPEYRHVEGDLTIPEFCTESGARLQNVTIRFETWGALNAERDNAVVICHALTGDSHAGDSHRRKGWWSGLIGPGKVVDVNRYFVVATNVLGGCSGSTGPASLAPDGHPYGLRFPLVTIRDMVRAQGEVLDALGVRGLHAVIGGSMGGMQAWEWPFVDGRPISHVCVIAAHSAFTPFGIGYNYAMRQAIVADPDWQGGAYYETGKRPTAGLATARAVGMLTYRTGPLFAERFGREPSSRPAAPSHNWEQSRGCAAPFVEPLYQVEEYLAYQGQSLNARFDANSYLYLTRAMDSHDIGRGRGGVEKALQQLRGRRLTIVGIDQDYLYSPAELRRDAEQARDCGVECSYLEMRSAYGHDAFLADQNQLADLLAGL
jgi:homoserine O-acetyltransferase